MIDSTYAQMSANQLVAYNLRRARQAYDWTQEQAAQALEKYIGVRWSVATWSAAETSTTSGRTREFSADEILAFAALFGKSVAYFFTPPDGLEWVACGPRADISRHVGRGELDGLIEGGATREYEAAAELRRIADKLDGGGRSRKARA
jgi:transcriptional regulator with XRE-family HTH domain